MTDSLDAAKLKEQVAALVDAAKKAGADAADAVAARSRWSGVSVRLGKIEGTEASESDDVSLRVFVGKHVASISATAASDPRVLADRAVAMAKASPEDPYQGLADSNRLAREIPDLDLFDLDALFALLHEFAALLFQLAHDWQQVHSHFRFFHHGRFDLLNVGFDLLQCGWIGCRLRLSSFTDSNKLSTENMIDDQVFQIAATKIEATADECRRPIRPAGRAAPSSRR